MAEDRVIRSAWGLFVDTSGDRWILDARHTLHFRTTSPEGVPALPGVMAAHRDYLRHVIRTGSAATAMLVHKVLKAALRHSSILEALAEPGPLILRTVQDAFRETMSIATTRTFLGVFRRFYVQSSDAREHDGFDPDAASAMVETVLKGNRAGMAVLAMDPDEGPLSEAEAQVFEEALGTAFLAGRVPLPEFVATMLTLTLGCRPENLYRLEDRDLIVPSTPDGPYVLRVPRVKVGGPPRSAFKERELPARIGRHVERLVRRNAELAPAEGGFLRPMFRRAVPRAEVLSSSQRAMAYHASAGWIGEAVSSIPDLLRAAGHADVPHRVTARRLRYTVTGRMVAEGFTPEQVADVLDHSGVANVMVYFDARLEMVPHLDERVGPILAPLARLFLRGGDPDELRSALTWERRDDPVLLKAPSACLACPNFRPGAAVPLRALAKALGSEVANMGVRRSVGPSRSDLVEWASAAATACDGIGEEASGRSGEVPSIAPQVVRCRSQRRV